MKKGDRYEYNTLDRQQFILTVKDWDDIAVFFNARFKECTGDFFNVEIDKKHLKEMIKTNNIGKI